jgi:hypothetical protein
MAIWRFVSPFCLIRRIFCIRRSPLRALCRGSAKRFSTGREPAARGVYPPRRTCRPGVVELGVLTIDKAVPDSLEAQKKLLFLPGQLTDGIEPSDDPLIGLRDGAYAVSFSRRNP